MNDPDAQQPVELLWRMNDLNFDIRCSFTRRSSPSRKAKAGNP
jgi:hypothetical protein